MKRPLLLLVSFLVVGGITILFALRSVRRDGPVVLEPPVPEERVVEEPPPPEPAPRFEPSPRAVSGRLLGAQASPLAGFQVVSGDETVTVDAAGSFAFPAALRPRRAAVRALKDGTEVAAWDGVLLGDRSPYESATVLPAPDPDPAVLSGIEPDSVATAGAVPGAESVGAEPTVPVDPAAEPATSEAAPIELAATEQPDSLPPLLEKIRWTWTILEGARRPMGEEWIRVDDVLAEDWGPIARIRVRGATRLPDGAQLACSMYFDGSRFLAAGEPAEVRGGTFVSSLYLPPELRLYSGTYEVRVVYSAVLQRPERWEEWSAREPTINWSALEVPEAQAQVFIGDPADAAVEDTAVGAYYSRVLDEVRQLERSLKSRVEEVLELAWGWDLETLRTLMDQMRYAEIVERQKTWDPAILATRRAAREGWYYGDLVVDGVFQEERWRDFLDKRWRPQLQALIDQHAIRDRPKYPEAEARMGALLRALMKESYALSSFVVYPQGLPRHPNDFYPDEDEVGDMDRTENIFLDNFSKLERYRSLGGRRE